MSWDLVGGPFAVVESDPGVFTTLLNRLGILTLEVEEVLSIDSLKSRGSDDQPHALILCYRLSESNPSKTKLEPFDADPDASELWFANQLDNDACATLTLLNTLLNCSGINLGDRLQEFLSETETFDPVMRGLAISNFDFLRRTHNSLARPCDVKAAMHALAQDAAPRKPVKRRTKLTLPTRRKREDRLENTTTYHYIGYVACKGHVWEMDGLNAGPIDLGELELTPNLIEGQGSETRNCKWMEIVAPAIATRIAHYLDRQVPGAEDGIEFNLLAIVENKYCRSSDRLQSFKREASYIERRLGELQVEDWKEKVAKDLLTVSSDLFENSSPIYFSDFASGNMTRSLSILRNNNVQGLFQQWETCVRSAISAREDMRKEVAKMHEVAVQNEKRCHDYEPFLREYLTALGREGLLEESLA